MYLGEREARGCHESIWGINPNIYKWYRNDYDIVQCIHHEIYLLVIKFKIIRWLFYSVDIRHTIYDERIKMIIKITFWDR